MKRISAWLLALALLAGLGVPALADEPLSLVPALNDYAAAGYTDVAPDSWYAQAAQACYETGLMMGTQAGFEPQRTLSVAETAAIAARLRAALNAQTIPQGGDGPWYAVYFDYLAAARPQEPSTVWAAIPFDGDEAAKTRPATRQDLLYFFAAALDGEFYGQLSAINAIQTLPDTDDAVVLHFYNAGVLTGVDAYGTFAGDKTLSRAECAAMVARVIRPQLRQSFVPAQVPAQTQTPEAPLPYEEALLEAEALRVNGQSIPFSTYLDTLNSLVFRTDFALAANGGDRLQWDAKYEGIDDLGQYFKEQALTQVLQDHLVSAAAASLGCSVQDLPQALFPDSAAVLDRVYLAKHILVSDQATAQAILAQLMAAPSLELFDQLMNQYTTDPGIKSDPDGYLFTDGDMIEVFTNAVKALDMGSCTAAPVQSQHGWHIILRLDPKTYPDWEKAVRSLLYEKTVEGWMNGATVTPNTVELNRLDVRAWYEKYLSELGM